MSSTEPSITILKDIFEVERELASTLRKKADEAIKERGCFTIGLSGGSLPLMLGRSSPSILTDWSKWVIFFCDERVVSHDHPDSTYGVYNKFLFNHITLNEDNIFSINTSLNVREAAEDYEKRLRATFHNESLPRFDVLLLGMGPDGHTCSLFPDHPLLKEKRLLVAPIMDSPKPPPERITMTYPLINNSRYVAFVVCGESKAESLKAILKDGKQLPAALVKPISGNVQWFLDEAAYSAIT